MKKVLVITYILVILAMSVAFADEAKWGIKVQGSGLDGNNAGDVAQIGVGLTSIAPFNYGTLSGVGVDAAAYDGTGLYNKVNRFNLSSWTVFIGAAAGYPTAVNNNKFRVTFSTMGSTSLLPAYVSSWPVFYEIYIDGYYVQTINKASYVANEVLWSTELATKLYNGNLLQNGYIITINQCEPPIGPEPSSFLALGSGIAGLAGFVVQRRRR